MRSAVVSASLGSAHVLPCKCAAARSGGHHDELRSGEKVDGRRSFRRPTTRAKLAKSLMSSMFQGEKLVRQEIATFPVLRRVGNTDDGKTNVQFWGRAAHLKLDQLTNLKREKSGRMKRPYGRCREEKEQNEGCANRRVGKSKDPKNRVPEIAVPDLVCTRAPLLMWSRWCGDGQTKWHRRGGFPSAGS